MTKFKVFAIAALAALCFIANPAYAQVNTLTQTTLSTQQLATDRVACLASATGVVLPSTSANGSTLFIQGTGAGAAGTVGPYGSESEVVQSVTSYSTTCFNVIRQVNPALHASGLTVYLGPRQWFASIDPRVGNGGTCTLASTLYYPYINLSSGQIFHCIASQWVAGEGQVTTAQPYTAFTTLSNPDALVAAGSVSDIAGQEWFSQIYIPSNTTLTGACWLNGATVTTDKRLAFLADAGGNIIANSAVAGVTTASASHYQCAAFTSTVAVYGPGTYYVGVQTAGTTDNFLGYIAGGAPTNYGTGIVASGVFGTLTAITPTVTFTTAEGPLMMVY
jgi:hypothetical protein